MKQQFMTTWCVSCSTLRRFWRISGDLNMFGCEDCGEQRKINTQVVDDRVREPTQTSENRWDDMGCYMEREP